MKTFRDYLKEEVTPIATSDGSVDIEKDEVRAHLNNILSNMVNKPWVTPYNVLTKVRKALAYFHIHLPKKTYLDGEKGVEVWEIHQFGHKMGFTDQGDWIHHVPCKYYLFFQYVRTGMMFMVTAKIVDQAELDTHLDAAERIVAEEAACQQDKAKMNAPKEPMHDVTSDEKKKGNKEAVADSEKGKLDEIKQSTLKSYGNKAYHSKSKAEMEKGKEFGPHARFVSGTKYDTIIKKREKGIERASDRTNPNQKWYVGEENIEEGSATGNRSYKGSPDRKRKAVQMALGRKHKDHPDWNERTNPQYSALKLGRKLQKQGVTEEKGDRLTPGFGDRKDFDKIAKEIGTGQGGMTIVDKAPKGGESSSQTIYPMSPKSTSRVAPDDVEKKLDTSTPGNPQAERNRDLKEKLTKKMSAGKVISDFVHSDDPKFKGKSTKERQKMALGAYYGMHPEKSKK